MLAVQRYGDFVRYPLGPLQVYLAAHPDHVRHVLQYNNRNYVKDTFQYNLLRSVTGDGLLVSDGPSWLQQRRLAQPAFHRQRIASFGGLMAQAAEEMVEAWAPAAAAGQAIDIAQEMMEVALKIVGRALFSIDVRREAAELAQAVLVLLEHVVGRARTLALMPEFLPTPGNLRARAALRRLDRFVYALIAERRRLAAEGQALPDDLLTMLMQARDLSPDPAPTGRGRNTVLTPDPAPNAGRGEPAAGMLSDRQLRDEVITLIIAGHETVASALAWAWYLLSQNPDACAGLHEEVDRVLGGRLPSVEDLPGLPYTRMVFNEALRLYPPAWIITRKALAEDRIGGYRVPAGALVVLSPYITQRLPAFWTEPERFRPERFSGQEAAGRTRFAYFPFGAGPRLCIGNTFALVEAQLVLVTAARRYRLELAPGRPVEVEPGVTLRPKHGLWMRPVRRAQRSQL